MKRISLAAAVLGLALLGACAVQPPSQTPVPNAPSTPAESVPATPTPQPSTTTATIPTTAITLGGNVVGKFKFGAKESEVLSWLEAELGEPSDIFDDPYCYFTEKSPYSMQVTWDAFTVVFLAKDTKKSSARTLQAWSYGLIDGLSPQFVLADGADPTLSFTQLKQKFPKGKKSSNPLGETVFTLPNKIRLTGLNDAPALIAAGYDDPKCIE
ncbi:MAG: hypothetical protein LBI99_06865 [Propionibacteriaceae bacterium]|nr:hypothetical protein [Propionibacteriaceae bacterium]